MSWDGIEEAVAIADAGTSVGAAARLRVSTSHVSRAVARLEERLGTVLFNRTTRRVTPTDTGAAFVEQGRRIFQERDELLSLANGSGEPQGDLKVTCSIALGESIVAPIVRRFAADHPRLAVTLDLTNRLVDLAKAMTSPSGPARCTTSACSDGASRRATTTCARPPPISRRRACPRASTRWRRINASSAPT